MARTDTPPAGDERSVLFQMLEYVQQTALSKVRGLDDEQARRAPVATSPLTTPASLLHHLRWNEHYWVEVVLLGRDDRAPWSDEHPDGELEEGLVLPVDEIVAGYGEQVQLSRALLAELDLDTESAEPLRDFHPNVRWVVQHLVEETARHNGHLDLLREMIDGSTGT
ncbi:DinB family protein [Aeromicrobium marinum]|nr:DinB family protein [Aeromicrobium marinum]